MNTNQVRNMSNHRSRFRREANTGWSRHANTNSALYGSSLGHRLAQFKYSPDPELERLFDVQKGRRLFLGACSKCTKFSGVTFLPNSIHNFSQMKNSIEKCFPEKTTDQEDCIIESGDDMPSKYLNSLINEEEYYESTKKQEGLTPKKGWKSTLYEWYTHFVLKILFPRGILYHPGQLEVLERCAKSQVPFLFLPAHKCNFDALLVKKVLSNSSKRHDLRTVIAINSSANISPKPSFEMVNAQLWQEDDTAWALQQTLVSRIFAQKSHILTLLEEKAVPCQDRPDLNLDTQLLDHAFQCIYDEVVRDIQVVPVSISFESHEVAPPQWPRSILDHVKMLVQSFWRSYQNFVRVDFDQPFSLREFEESFNRSLADTRVEDQSDAEVYQALKSTLARHSLCSSWLNSRIMLTDFHRLQQNDHLYADLHRLTQELRVLNLGFTGPKISKPLEGGSLIHEPLVLRLIGREGIVATALLSLIAKRPMKAYVGTHANVSVNHDELIAKSAAIFDLLSFEDHFAFPCQDWLQVAEETVEVLKQKELLRTENAVQSENFQEKWARRMASQVERELCDEDDEEAYGARIIGQVYQVSLKDESVKSLLSYYHVIKPILLSYLHLLEFLENAFSNPCNDEPCFDCDFQSVSNLTDVPSSRAKNLFAKLLEWKAAKRCQLKDHFQALCIAPACDSLKPLMPELRKFIF